MKKMMSIFLLSFLVGLVQNVAATSSTYTHKHELVTDVGVSKIVKADACIATLAVTQNDATAVKRQAIFVNVLVIVGKTSASLATKTRHILNCSIRQCMCRCGVKPLKRLVAIKKGSPTAEDYVRAYSCQA